jgi:ketosteroid isomerase-like protein
VISPGTEAFVREMFATWNDSNVERMFDFWTEDGDWTFADPPDLPDAKRVAGSAAVKTHLRELMSVIGGMRIEAEEVTEISGRVLAVVRFTIEGSLSGIQLDAPSFHVIELDGGRVRHYRTFSDREQAVSAAQDSG